LGESTWLGNTKSRRRSGRMIVAATSWVAIKYIVILFVVVGVYMYREFKADGEYK
jgi:hypothetical protein